MLARAYSLPVTGSVQPHTSLAQMLSISSSGTNEARSIFLQEKIPAMPSSQRRSVIRSWGTPPGLTSSDWRSKPASLPEPSWVGWPVAGRLTASIAAVVVRAARVARVVSRIRPSVCVHALADEALTRSEKAEPSERRKSLGRRTITQSKGRVRAKTC